MSTPEERGCDCACGCRIERTLVCLFCLDGRHNPFNYERTLFAEFDYGAAAALAEKLKAETARADENFASYQHVEALLADLSQRYQNAMSANRADALGDKSEGNVNGAR